MLTLNSNLSKGKDLSDKLGREGKLRRGQLMKSIFKYSADDHILLAHGLPRTDSFSIKEFSFKYSTYGSDKVQEAKIEKSPTEKSLLSLDKGMQYGSGKGSANLVDHIKKHVELAHFPKYSNWDVVLTTGNTEALYQATTLLSDWGDSIIVAKWTYPPALETFRGKGLRFIVADIDEEGIIPSSIEDSVKEYYQSNPNAPKCKLIYTVPTGQNPSGATMSLERRQEFYRVCQKLDLMILEDDPYYFFQLPPYKPDGEYKETR
ncbi:PLP-dependent transferase [Conidiobolus coronatus NRRL 28638]|uniref:PLP-dependent transferase n=1 Tax=Conidiobolus coronatus (strain ATCC 28846 / CBS 209.66 / NRRL 28638) TaxID=796925 RepID=A0A137NTC8_CONC2|nr:PLP-dependent transferase [Conidiobolus coronatus NRRL 28638]|eukprot:KXN66055.1 PLP-dependent transferase [Conidiobolus coronatus NRRL 28638]